MLSVPHLDREFDYLVSTEQSDDAQPGVRVRVRFHGRLVDAFVLERRSDTDHVGKLGWLDRVVSAEPVLTPEVRRLVDAVAARYAGTRADVLRLAVPPRHANVEKQTPPEPAAAFRQTCRHGRLDRATGAAISSLRALSDGRAARAVWQALPGERWADRLAEAAAVTVNSGRGVLAILPDQRDVDALYATAIRHVDEDRVVALSAGLGPAQRYRRWLSVLRGDARMVIGTRSAVFAPVADLGLVMVWDDGDDTLAEPRAPYPHAREVAMLRAHQLRCAALIGGYARTAEAQALVRSRWAHDLVAARPVVRARSPRVVALDDSGHEQERDPAAQHRAAAVDGIAGRADRAASRVCRCWFRCRGAATCPRWPVRAAGPSRAAGTAPDRCRCRTATPPGRYADGAAARSRRCAACAAGPTRCAPWSWARGAPQRNSAGRFRASR